MKRRNIPAQELVFRFLFAYVLLSFLWFLYELFACVSIPISEKFLLNKLGVSFLKGLGFTVPTLLLIIWNQKRKAHNKSKKA